jgi:hypothetical protein
MDYSISLASGVVAEQLTKPWLVVPICYIGGSKIVLVTSAHKVHVYDPNTNALHILASPDDMEKPRTKEPSEFLRFVLYQESLVQLDDMEHADREIKFVKL